MKHLLRSLFLLLFAVQAAFGQKKLTNSRISDNFTYIYKLSDKEAYAVASEGKTVINDAFLHTRIDSFYHASNKPYRKNLPFGNYLYVKAVKNQLVYRLTPKNNVNLQFINNRKNFQFAIIDLKGRQISTAEVTVGKGKRIRYNATAKLYVAGSGSKEGVITVRYEGVSNFFTYEEQESYGRYAKNDPSLFKKIFEKKRGLGDRKRGVKTGYSGYMVFNKPMYKPLDTVKFKAYLVTSKGKSIGNKPLRVELNKDYNAPGSLLTTLDPYRDGGYEFSFVLADSLQLKLDRNYTIVLKEQQRKEWEQVYQGNFRYEDYELKSVNFTVRTDKNEYSPGNPANIFMKATDENELAVPDGRVEVLVRTNTASKFYSPRLFVKDTLWKTSLVLDPVGETKLLLPDSIFPKADIDFEVSFVFLNSNNERRTASKSLKYRVKEQDVKVEFKKDSLYLDYQVRGNSVRQKASVSLSFPNSDEEEVLKVELPAAIKMNYSASGYYVKTNDGYDDYIFMEDLKPEIKVDAVQGKDSLQVLVNNQHKIPFWYTIFSGNKVFLRGYGTRLDTTIRHTSAKAAHVKLNYSWGEKELDTETSAFYRPGILNVKLLSPDLVYPGQTVNMQVKVTDANDLPVASTDVTAYAYTSKFKNGYSPGIPYFGKPFFARKISPGFEAEDIDLQGEMSLTWERWGKALNLDTIEYYRFTQTKDLYAIQEEGPDTALAVVAPFVVKNGAITPAHIVYIDDVPVYFSQANQLQRYAFRLSPGKHNIQMRTSGYLVSLDDYEFAKGKKTILSVNADLQNTKARVSKLTPLLSAEESAFLTKYMIRIENNFNGDKAILTPVNERRGDSAAYFLSLSQDQPALSSGLLVGPIKENYLTIESGSLKQTFMKEPGYTYTFLPGLLKQKSYGTPYGFNTTLTAFNGSDDYRQYPLKSGELDSIWNNYLDLRSRTTSLINNSYPRGRSYGKLVMKLDTGISNQMPYLKNIVIYKYDEPDFLQVYPGNASYFNVLEQSIYRIIYLFKDNRYFVAEDVDIKAGGINYFEWKGVKIQAADRMSTGIDLQIKSVNIGSNSPRPADAQQNILQNINDRYFNPAILTGRMNGRIIDAKTKLPIVAAAVKIKGASYGVNTGANGYFEIKVPKRGKVIVSFIGYDSREINVINGDAGEIKLDAATALLEEVVVVGYGVQKKQNLTGAISAITSQELGYSGAAQKQEMDARMVIRGLSTSSGGQKPLLIVDGLPFTGDISALDQSSIVSLNILKDAEATAIYGARAAGGVIIVKTKGRNTVLNAAGTPEQQQSSLRSNFSDYAIWQPKLFTDADGKAGFTVKFPDDVTSWTTRLVAMNSRKQAGVAETTIKSFKMLSANFVSPQFALEGDSIGVIGKLMNYSNADETVNRRFSYNGTELLNGKLTFKHAKIDTVPIVARGYKGMAADSLSFEYTMKQDNGYSDGELRKIPVFKAGITETKGLFNALGSDTTIVYKFDPALGKVILRAEASVFPVLLDEIDKLRNYEYLCNEQLASKLRALLLEKSVRKYLGQDFKGEKQIKVLLKKLQDNRRPEGTWGWWQNSGEELWISLHVVETLLEAQKQGYEVVLDKNKLYSYLLDKMTGDVHFDQIYGIKLLSLLNEKYYANDWIIAIEKRRVDLEAKNARERKANSDVPLLPKQPLYEKLQLMHLKQKAGMPVDISWLMGLKKETMFGNFYWGEENRYFWDNSIQNTLMAYQVFKVNGGHKKEMEGIQRYFLEQRKDGQWRNTYESSLILQTILPELMADGRKAEPAAIVLNNENITVFPHHKVIEPAALTLIKKGKTPVYFTAYQQFHNPSPQKVSKDFTVKTWFDQNGETVRKLKAGTLTDLKVEVEVRADADYVMVEVPIPAGCSYENKMQTFWGTETHREYFKHKTSIFCSKLKKGKYMFNIQLMPRYSGNYILNPAKAEMMYFPVFYGREGMKDIAIN
ncbi:alpha-2-macroglobulin family protein [Pedobacter africanus]|uniref:TonB-dependent outer membrane receptor, SusC/RagA subfamily, signature region n=1 Tax=Pedobacter africanus TaxID=151894 RepID=A0A1W1ZKL8_9SPHI|nr:carboxypeptidase-like regulatory domain-containing protein [Pedobacter africanus]SMC49100.1 TonB-dependent outer membrane receptor, SusC/RagA subfamily, signature region [Pedobacter africanus]